MNRASFDTYVETQLAPTLRKGDVIILDNLSSHKSQYAANPLRGGGAWLLFLPPYSPSDPDRDRLLKAIGVDPQGSGLTYDALWNAVGNVCDLFTNEGCFNFFKAAGSGTD